MKDREREIRQEIAGLVAELHEVRESSKPAFEPGKSTVAYAGRVHDEKEIQALVDSSLDFWLTLGKYGKELERELANYVGTRSCVLVNSGSSANLLAFAALTSHKLDRPIRPGDEVITTAAGFPTTVNPIVQYGCIPVFVDVDPVTMNPDPNRIEAAIGDKTRAIMMAHTLGNPMDMDALQDICKRHNLYFIEDNCDALGSLYRGRKTGSFGITATQSFYPPHHMTLGEGGAVLSADPKIRSIVSSFRDWGKDCWCPSGKDDTCSKRFDWQLGTLPHGYDHKYIFSHIGYNMKPLELQAAIGLEQIKKLPDFVQARRRNYDILAEALAPLGDQLQYQRATEGSEPSWFAFLVTVAEGARVSRDQAVATLERCGIQTRMLFGGNLTRQPAYQNVAYRAPFALDNSDAVLDRGFFVGVYPGTSEAQQRYVADTIAGLFDGRVKPSLGVAPAAVR